MTGEEESLHRLMHSILPDEFSVNRSTRGSIENDARAITTAMTMSYMTCHGLNPTVHNCFPIRYRSDSVPIALFSIPRCAPRQQAARIDRYIPRQIQQAAVCAGLCTLFRLIGRGRNGTADHTRRLSVGQSLRRDTRCFAFLKPFGLCDRPKSIIKIIRCSL